MVNTQVFYLVVFQRFTRVAWGGICTCGLRPSLPWFSTVGKLRLVVVAVQGAPRWFHSIFASCHGRTVNIPECVPTMIKIKDRWLHSPLSRLLAPYKGNHELKVTSRAAEVVAAVRILLPSTWGGGALVREYQRNFPERLY